jgi:hypothetical protein
MDKEEFAIKFSKILNSIMATIGVFGFLIFAIIKKNLEYLKISLLCFACLELGDIKKYIVKIYYKES